MIHYHLESSQDCRPTQLHLQSFQNNNKTDNNNVDWETAAAAVVVATVAGHQRGSSNVSGDPAQQCNSFVRAVSFKKLPTPSCDPLVTVLLSVLPLSKETN